MRGRMIGRIDVKPLFWTLLGVTLLASPALAEQEKIDCDNAITTHDMIFCAGDDFQEADAALNTTYREAMRRAEAIDREASETDIAAPGAVEALRSGQRGWIAYRDGQCTAVAYGALGGTIAPLLDIGCQTGLTQKRTEELKALFNPE